MEGFVGIVVGLVEIEVEGLERWKRDFMVEGTFHDPMLGADNWCFTVQVVIAT